VVTTATPKTIAVLGAGSWGTALALLLARNGHQIKLWGYKAEFQRLLLKEKENHIYLPGYSFPENLLPVIDLETTITNSDEVLIAVPSKGFRQLLETAKKPLSTLSKLSWASKGFDQQNQGLLHEVVREVLDPAPIPMVISGPSFALEVASQQPTAITLAGERLDQLEETANLYRNEQFRVYTSDDIIGVEVGGALKNVMAIAVGISQGLGLGANAKAALITRGLAEMSRLGQALGGRQETLMGLSGAGDLFLTCSDTQSRNLRFGQAIGKGASIQEAFGTIGQVVEGYDATAIAYKISQQNRIDMPIVTQTFNVLYDNLSPAEAVNNLLRREPKPEHH
jgi:glycerol-3-phosphate dehydrogenase (NAD(P)+)